MSKPEKDKNNYRNYLEKDVEQLKYILILKEVGFSIKKDIKKVIEIYVACLNRDNRLEEVKKEFTYLYFIFYKIFQKINKYFRYFIIKNTKYKGNSKFIMLECFDNKE